MPAQEKPRWHEVRVRSRGQAGKGVWLLPVAVRGRVVARLPVGALLVVRLSACKYETRTTKGPSA